MGLEEYVSSGGSGGKSGFAFVRCRDLLHTPAVLSFFCYSELYLSTYVSSDLSTQRFLVPVAPISRTVTELERLLSG